MDDTWFDPDVTGQDMQSFLQALSLHDRQRTPLLAVASDDTGTPRLVLASRALFALFGVASAEALSGRLLRGNDPGAKRLATLFQTLSLESAPRLERLRFFVGPSNEIITFLCRRMLLRDRPVFIAAALNVRTGLIPDAPAAPPVALAEPTAEPALHPSPALAIDALAWPEPEAATEAARAPEPDAPIPAEEPALRDAAALQAELRQRWPAGRVRFLWQTDADAVCTLITPPLAEVVGPGTADLVGRNLLDLAPQLDPSGRLAERLAARETWSGLDLEWPLADAAATVAVVAGAIPAFGPDKVFDGFRGFGVIHLDRLKDATPHAWALPEPIPRAANVVPFPGGAKGLSSDDHVAFREIGETLRKEVPVEAPAVDAPAHALPQSGSAEVPALGPQAFGALPAEAVASAMARDPAPVTPDAPTVAGPEPVALAAAEREPIEPAPAAADESPLDPAPAPESAAPTAHQTRADDVSRNGLTVLDKLALGLLVSRDNVPIFANRHLLDMLGFADEDALHAAGGMTHLFGGLSGSDGGSEAVGIRSRDGTILPVGVRMQVVDWDGLPATLLTLRHESAADAAPRSLERDADGKRQDGELRQLRAILETATDGVAVLDADCNVLSLNRSGEALFGCDRSAVIGKPFLTLFAPHNQSLASDYFEGLKSSPTKSLLNDGREFLVKAHQGGTIPIFMTMGRLGPSESAAAGDEARFCALFRDLTHWKKAEQELDTARRDAERASALKTDFLAKVSHEIRTPLNAIIGFAEVIMDERFGPVGNERYKDYLRDIHSSGTHVMSLVNDLLDLSKIEAGKMELQALPIDANKIIGECVSLMQPQASRERVIMRLSLAASLPRILADERSVRQIVLNLLSNAVKFNDPGGQVIVATALTEAGQVVIRIRDTGPGMSDSDIEMALEPFRQLSNARPMTGGTGLGLPLTKALVEANQASFTIRSKVDQGTLVEVAFPADQVLAG